MWLVLIMNLWVEELFMEFRARTRLTLGNE